MKKTNKKGFTLVEIMIVVAIIGLLAAIGIPSFQKARANTMKKNAINNARIVLSAVDQYAMENGVVGTNTVDSTEYLPYVKGEAEGLAIGEATLTTPDVDGSETAEELAAKMYTEISFD